MKEYTSRLKQGGGIQVFVFWWLMRVAMLAFFAASLFNDTYTITSRLHIAVCLIGSFLWEFSMAMPEKSFLRLMPTSIHTAINIGLAVSSVLGVYFNFYYNVRYFGVILQAFFSFVTVLYGYEVAYALVKKKHFSATKAMVYYVAFGFAFICFNAWELGEFFADQLVGHLTGSAGNAQFWSQAIAEGTAMQKTILPPLVEARAPLMGIMCDVITHSASAFAALIFINLCPYRLRGKYKYDIEYGNNAVKVKEIVNK